MEVYLPLGRGARYSQQLINRRAYKSPYSSNQVINYLVNQVFHHYAVPDLSFLDDADIVQLELALLLPFSRLSGMLRKKNVVFDLQSITAFDLEPFIPTHVRAAVLPLLIRMQERVIENETCIAVSHTMKRYIQKQYGYDGDNIHVVHPGVNLDYAKEMESRYMGKYQWIRDSADLIIAFVGTLLPVEGVDFLVMAMSQVLEQIGGVKLFVIGSGPEERTLKALVRKLRIGRSVEFLGWIPYEETFAAQRQADILACPLKPPGHGTMISSIAFPIKIPQYLASRKPILTTHVGDIPKYIRHEKEGLVLRNLTVDNLADAIIRLAGSDSLRAEMASRCKKMAMQLTWDKSVNKLESVYLGLLD